MVNNCIEYIEILHYDCVDSTNKVAFEYQDNKHLLTILSDTQTNGRGRMGRDFYSYNGGLYMSVILEPRKIQIPFHICTPTAALAVLDTLEMYGVCNCELKWVNDILLDGRKICGILTECRTENNEIERIVVGIGINISESDIEFPEDIKQKAGTVNINDNRKNIACSITKQLGNYLSLDVHEIVSEYEKRLNSIGKIITVTDYADNYKRITGKVIGITDDCFLKIELSDKTTKIISSGEII